MHVSQLPVLSQVEQLALAAVHRNPGCHSWCTVSHRPTEFLANMGVLLCRRTFGESQRFVERVSGLERAWGVYVEGGWQLTDGDDIASPVEASPVELAFGYHLDSVALSEVPEFTSAVIAASVFCEQLRHGSDTPGVGPALRVVRQFPGHDEMSQ